MSVNTALKNVKRSKLENEIQVIKVTDNQNFFNVVKKDSFLHFTICNPPFYSSTDDEELSRSKKKTSKFTDGTLIATKNERITDEGELSFVSRIARDSLIAKDMTGWFTSWIGKKSDIDPIKLVIQKLNPPPEDIRVVTLKQGMTNRWVIAWTWMTKSK